MVRGASNLPLWVAKTASVQEVVNLQRLVAELSRLIFRPHAQPNFAQVTIRQAQAEKCRRALALYFLGFIRPQIKRLLPIKSETVRSYILAFTVEVRDPGTRPYRMLGEDALESLAQELEKAYGLGDLVREVIPWNCWESDQFSAGTSAFLRQFRPFAPPPVLLMRKLGQILRTQVRRPGPFILLMGRNGRRVRLRAPRPDTRRPDGG